MKKLGLLLLMQFWVVFVFGQYSLKGVVTGNNEPLAGASVVVKNTFNGVSAGSNGRFEFRNLKKGNYVIKVSFIGFETTEMEVSVNSNQEVKIELQPDVVMTDEILVSATRVGEKSPFSYSTVSKDEIANRNMGHDIPYLLQMTPSFVATSDAGAGVGYTNFRIRGTDLNRVNVTVNGIPLNDAESHGTWFVDQPDLASSLENIQVQRGVGTSTNGAAAFGATLNLQTNTLEKDAYAGYKTAAGSFNTFKNTVSAGTGLLDGKFTLDARLSKVSSDGFVDRAFSDLKSFFVSGGYYSENSVVKINVFSGLEETYQSWNGVPSVRLNIDLEGMQRYGDHWLYSEKETQEMIQSGSRTYNLYTYKNQVDHFQQDHYQLFFSHKFSQALNLNLAGHYTHGSGYYENYKADQDFADYRLDYPVVGSEMIESTDLITRKWLDNDFYGLTYSLNYKKMNSDFTLGGGWNTYDGDHFGKIIWAEYLFGAEKDQEWYRGTGLKKDFNVFAKYNFQWGEKVNLYADAQYRRIDYSITGIDDDLRDITQEHAFNFFNPKLGMIYQPAANQKLYLSYAVANREPNRDNYVDADPAGKQPVHETLRNWETGYSVQASDFTAGANFYFMDYKNQLVLTGKINDVGAPVMENVDNSYRAGMELQGGWKISRLLLWNVNATFSRNKIKNYTEFVDNWDEGGQSAFDRGTTDIAFSPAVIANSQLVFSPAKNLNFRLGSSYVGKQFIDNSSDNDRVLEAYFVNNLKMDYSFKTSLFNEITLHFQVNNLLNEEYESNAWVYSYIYEGVRNKMDGYFPQAGRHFMAGINVKF
jgi:iron complex outermembrane receptor protein